MLVPQFLSFMCWQTCANFVFLTLFTICSFFCRFCLAPVLRLTRRLVDCRMLVVWMLLVRRLLVSRLLVGRLVIGHIVKKPPSCSPRPSRPEIYSQTELVLLLTSSLIMHSARSHCSPPMGPEPA